MGAAKQLSDQLRGLHIAQWAQRYGVRAMHPGQRTFVLGAIGDQHDRVGLRDDRQEVAKHRLTDFVDPVRILDHIDAGLLARQRRTVDQGGHSAPAGACVDVGQRHVGIRDAKQVIQQQQILGIGVRYQGADVRPGCRSVETVDPEARP
jgi:hypothetical protein